LAVQPIENHEAREPPVLHGAMVVRPFADRRHQQRQAKVAAPMQPEAVLERPARSCEQIRLKRINASQDAVASSKGYIFIHV
jgi:hypothetical protein